MTISRPLWASQRGGTGLWRGGLWASQRAGGGGGAEIIGVALVDDSVQGGSFVWIDESGNEITQPDTAYFDAHPAFQLTDETIDGQAMVRVPKSYYRRDQIEVGAHGVCDCWWVSDQPATDLIVFPAFEFGGGEVDQFWYGKYEGYLDGESKLASQPGVTPSGSRSWAQFQADAEARNVGAAAGFRQAHIDMRAVIQWLYLVEHGSFDSQATTAEGNTTSSSVQQTDSADNAAASYRGIYALWGNLSEWVDGLRHNSGLIERRSYGGVWESTGESRSTTGARYPNSWRQSASVEDLFIFDGSQSSSSGASTPDLNRYANSGERIAYVGGSNSEGAACGLWYQDVTWADTYSPGFAGSRLARVV